MPIQGEGWEFHVVRNVEQARASDGKRRTVGVYQIFHEGIRQTGRDLSGAIAETRGPGANAPAANNRRIETGRYPLYAQDGRKYATIGYVDSTSPYLIRKPGIELMQTGQRSEILIHPGFGFLSSVGCFNPCTSLPDAAETIDFRRSRERVIAIIDDLRHFLGTQFPRENGRRLPNAFVVVDGEPLFARQSASRKRRR